MKKFIFLAILLFVAPAMAVTLSWDANTDSTVGYIIYYQKVDAVEIYSKVVPGRETTSLTIDDNKFMAGQEYKFWATAYNKALESGPSDIVKWLSSEFIPIDNSAPVIITIPANPGGITINIGN